MPKPKILIQLDTDQHPSTFDAVVAVDSGADHIFRHGGIDETNVEGLIHGAIFTRGVDDLKSTAIFLGGGNIDLSEAILKKVTRTFFGPMRVSVMSDPNGANTTAAAAVLSAEQHINWSNIKRVAILGGTGPVGRKIAQIIGTNTAGSLAISLVSRNLSKAEKVVEQLGLDCGCNPFEPIQTTHAAATLAAISSADVVFAAGAAGVELIGADWQSLDQLKLAIDLNAVPPLGINGIEVMDRGIVRGKTICYGAIGVGGLKMKIHKRCVESLFESKDSVLRVNEIYRVGRQLLQPAPR